jgi:phosphate starvation-inducible PhoH-like protein
MTLFGNFDQNIKFIEEETGVQIIARETQLRIIGEEEKVALAANVIHKLLDMIRNREPLGYFPYRICNTAGPLR